MTVFRLKEDRILPFPNAKEFDPQRIGDAMEDLKARVGSCDADVWVGEARADPNHPAHRHYDWDVEHAAVQHWKQVTLQLWNSIDVVDGRTHRPEPAHISLINSDGHRERFSTGEIKTSPFLQLAMVKRFEADLKGILGRLRSFNAIYTHLQAAMEAAAMLRAELEAALEAEEQARSQAAQRPSPRKGKRRGRGDDDSRIPA